MRSQSYRGFSFLLRICILLAYNPFSKIEAIMRNARFLALCFLLVSLPTCWSQQQKPTNHKNDEVNTQQTQPTTVVAQSSPDSGNNKSNAENKTEQGPHMPPWWDAGWANWLLVAVGGIAAWIAVRTLKVIEGQLSAMRDQIVEMRSTGKQTDALIKNSQDQATATADLVTAANNNTDNALFHAQAVVNAERPWMLIKIQTSASPPVHPGVIPEHMSFSVSFHNWGKTPAEIIAFEQHPDCRDNTTDLPWPPTYDTPEGEVMTHTRIVPPGGEWYDLGEPSFSPASFLVGDQWNNIRNSHQRFVYWGKLRYRSLIEDPKNHS